MKVVTSDRRMEQAAGDSEAGWSCSAKIHSFTFPLQVVLIEMRYINNGND